MMKKILIILILFISIQTFSQQISGLITDKKTGESLIGASVIDVNTNQGTSTNFDGLFTIEYQTLPITIEVSYIGYETLQLNIEEVPQEQLKIELSTDKLILDLITITDSRLTKKLKESPLTVEAMDVTAIIEAPSSTFYESIGNLKGVDITSASLGFKIINTRGFNSTSPVRSLQIIDGVDNQSPGLNFSLGNFLGTTELDTKGVEIVVGANSALYGPNAFNGVIDMSTKDPFMFPGTSYQVKMGERSLIENCFRHADSMLLKNNWEFGYKLNIQHMKANDWEAGNMNVAYDSPSDLDNPGGYDAVNIYGDEWFREYGFSQNKPGLGTVHRTGYLDSDLVDYNTNNLKFNTSLHLRKDDNEFIYSLNYGNGTTIYHGDNRISLKNIQFLQNRLEFRRKDNFFIRLYSTHEDAGDSYDAVATASSIVNEGAKGKEWMLKYSNFWSTEIRDLMENNTDWNYISFNNWEGNDEYSPDLIGWETYIDNLFEQHPEILAEYHALARDYADTYSLNPNGLMAPFISPNSAEFDSLFQYYTSNTRFDEYGNFVGGSRFYDKSSLYHLQIEKQINTSLGNFIIGGNSRLYRPDSNGSIFNDGYVRLPNGIATDQNGDTIYTTESSVTYDPVTGQTYTQIDSVAVTDSITQKLSIQNYEFGLYLGYNNKIADEKILINATARLDKNENFDYLFSPAASLVFKPNKRDVFRVSLSSAIRNPTLTDQYFDYDQGIATLKGNINGFGYDEYFVQIDSLIAYFDGDYYNPEALRGSFMQVDPIQPEQVKTLETGFRTTLFEKLYIDASYYYSRYKNFIGYQIGATYEDKSEAFTDENGNIIQLEATQADVDDGFADFVGQEIDNHLNPAEGTIEIYRIAANAQGIVTSQGFTIGLNYYMNEKTVLNGNYSWNKLINEDSKDPIVPAYNTPEHKFNLGISHKLLIANNEFNISCNYKWQQEFVFEGSPQFTGLIPSYGLVDAQINKSIQLKNTSPNSDMMIKIGASNLLNNKIYQTYGGPEIGRLGYISFTFDF